MAKPYNFLYMNICRWWLTGILLFLPFQDKLKKSVKLYSNGLSSFIAYLDEITIVIFLLLVIKEFFKNREIYNKLHLILLFPLLVLSISGFVSGIVNRNSLLITTLGTFDYIKNFMVIFIYTAFFKEFEQFKKIFRAILLVTVFLGVIALIQELWAMWFRYILKEDIHNIRYLLVREGQPALAWSGGIYKARSLVGNNIVLGLYGILILTIYINITKKINFAVIVPLLSGILFSVSKMVYAAFAFVMGMYLFRTRKWFIILAIPALVFIIYMGFLTVGLDAVNVRTGERFPLRSYAREKAIEIWKDNKFLGVGPGMYGGIISIKMNSPYYEWDKYNFLPIAKHYVQMFSGIDQFWPHILAEVGILGVFGFIGLFISILVILSILRQRASSEEIRGLFTALIIYTFVIVIYSLGSGLNVAALLFTYSAFVGMGLGSISNILISGHKSLIGLKQN